MVVPTSVVPGPWLLMFDVLGASSRFVVLGVTSSSSWPHRVPRGARIVCTPSLPFVGMGLARAFTAKQTNADGVTLRRKRRFTTATKQQQYAEGHDPLATSVYLMLRETISTTYTAHMMRNNQRH